jgi:uracil-DNA glycosylase
MTPERPNVLELLTFYLEAGVDCALAEEPVNRLSDPELVPAASETAPAKPVRTVATAIPVARGEAAPAPEAAIQSAREAARTAPTLETLRALLENFDGCALRHTATRLVFADGIRRPASCSSAKPLGARKTSKGCRSSDVPASCWTG